MAADKRITVYLEAEDKERFEKVAKEMWGRPASDVIRVLIKREIATR